jgi:hypothetical protein
VLQEEAAVEVLVVLVQMQALEQQIQAVVAVVLGVVPVVQHQDEAQVDQVWLFCLTQTFMPRLQLAEDLHSAHLLSQVKEFIVLQREQER